MKQDAVTEGLLRRYLLGQLDEPSRQRIEERLMTEAAFVRQLDLSEDGLADEYAAGRLASRDAEDFERLFMADARRRQDVTFARALRKYVVSQPPAPTGASGRLAWSAHVANLIASPRSAFQLALAVTCIVLLVAVGALFYRATRLQRQVDGLLAQRPELSGEQNKLARDLAEERSRRSRLEQELAALKAQNRAAATAGAESQSQFVAITLIPGLARSSGNTQRLIFPGGKSVARLTLMLEAEPYERYNVSVQTPEGKEVWRQNGLRAADTPQGRAVLLQLSRGTLGPEDYIIKLTGIGSGGASEGAGTYYLRVFGR